MNKKLNTLLFIVGATFFNIITTILSFIILLFLYSEFIVHLMPDVAQEWSFPIMFISAIVISFVIYKFAIGFILKKIDTEKYFGSYIKSRKHKS